MPSSIEELVDGAPLSIEELVDNALIQAVAYGTNDDLVTEIRTEIHRRVTDVREVLLAHLGDCLPVRILDGFE